jgi:DNA-binding CsgD family transcriptional regulator
MVLLDDKLERRSDIMASILEDTESGIVILEGHDIALYANSSARMMLQMDGALFPTWVRAQLIPLIDRLWASRVHMVERWVIGEIVLRVRARPLDRGRAVTTLEITVIQAQASAQGNLAEPLAQALRLAMPDARLLAFLWRGMSNEEIAGTLNVRLGTVKSRLFRLYQKLGVKKRSMAVLRAAEVLKERHSVSEPGPAGTQGTDTAAA